MAEALKDVWTLNGEKAVDTSQARKSVDQAYRLVSLLYMPDINYLQCLMVLNPRTDTQTAEAFWVPGGVSS